MSTSSASKEELCSYSWAVQLYNAWQGYSSEPLLSPTFSNSASSKLTWRLRFEVGNSQNSSLFLILVSSDRSEVRAKFKFRILASDLLKLVESSSEPFSFCVGASHPLDFPRARVSSNLSHKLTIDCDVTVFPEQIKVPKCSLSDDLCQLFEKQRFTDVTLSVKGTEFQAHRNILAARSPVFAAMLEHDLEEKNTGIVKINDFDGDVIKEMLLFIYTGRVLNLDTMADGLLAASEKYGLDRLKAICEKSLRRNLSIENASEVLILAHLHNADQLKVQTIDFINANAKDVIKTAGFKTMADTYTSLVVELFVASVTK